MDLAILRKLSSVFLHRGVERGSFRLSVQRSSVPIVYAYNWRKFGGGGGKYTVGGWTKDDIR